MESTNRQFRRTVGCQSCATAVITIFFTMLICVFAATPAKAVDIGIGTGMSVWLLSLTDDDDNIYLIDNGKVYGTLYAKYGNDTISINGSDMGGTFCGDYATATANDGNDTVTWTQGSFSGSFYGANGADTMEIIGSVPFTGGSTQSFDGGEGTSDVFSFTGFTGEVDPEYILNWETVNLTDTTLSVTVGAWDISAGTGSLNLYNSEFDGGSGLTITALAMTIDADSTFAATGDGAGAYHLSGSLSNSGTINMQDSVVGDKVTVAGDYSGDGTIALDTDFSTSTSDVLVLEGNVSSGGAIAINDLKSTSADSSSQILLIDLPSDSNKDDERFTLAAAHQYNGQSDLGRFNNSPFIWKLMTSGNNWVLGGAYYPESVSTEDSEGSENPVVPVAVEKPAVVSEIPAEISLATFSYEVAVNKLETLHQRLGELRSHRAWAGVDPGACPASGGLFLPMGFRPDRINGWMKSMFAGFDIGSDDNFAADGKFGAVTIGFDRRFTVFEDHALFAGLYCSGIDGEYDNSGEGASYGSLYKAHSEVDGWSTGLYATWMNTRGTYLDLVLDYMFLDADIQSVDFVSTDGDILSASLEGGQSFAVYPAVIVEPQIQVKVSYVDWDSFYDGYNIVVPDDHTYITGRAGVRAEYTHTFSSKAQFKPWIYVGVQHEFTDSPTLNNVMDFDSHDYGTCANFQLGLTQELSSRVQLYADAGGTFDFDDYRAWRVDIGFRFQF